MCFATNNTYVLVAHYIAYRLNWLENIKNRFQTSL